MVRSAEQTGHILLRLPCKQCGQPRIPTIFSLMRRVDCGKAVDLIFSPSSNVAEQSGQIGFLVGNIGAVFTVSTAKLLFRLKKKDSPNQINIIPMVINSSILRYISIVYFTFIKFSSLFSD
jgi:hypothetical protein